MDTLTSKPYKYIVIGAGASGSVVAEGFGRNKMNLYCYLKLGHYR